MYKIPELSYLRTDFLRKGTLAGENLPVFSNLSSGGNDIRLEKEPFMENFLEPSYLEASKDAEVFR